MNELLAVEVPERGAAHPHCGEHVHTQGCGC